MDYDTFKDLQTRAEIQNFANEGRTYFRNFQGWDKPSRDPAPRLYGGYTRENIEDYD